MQEVRVTYLLESLQHAINSGEVDLDELMVSPLMPARREE